MHVHSPGASLYIPHPTRTARIHAIIGSSQRWV